VKTDVEWDDYSSALRDFQSQNIQPDDPLDHALSFWLQTKGVTTEHCSESGTVKTFPVYRFPTLGPVALFALSICFGSAMVERTFNYLRTIQSIRRERMGDTLRETEMLIGCTNNRVRLCDLLLCRP
tara:strand:+ start:2297 stop:2677 length:381 start_codon:yes stop_codon:yes gene_type:complete